jgi:hypothetical protein
MSLFVASDSKEKQHVPERNAKDKQHVPERNAKDPVKSAPANEELDGATSILPTVSRFGLLVPQFYSGDVSQPLKKLFLDLL